MNNYKIIDGRYMDTPYGRCQQRYNVEVDKKDWKLAYTLPLLKTKYYGYVRKNECYQCIYCGNKTESNLGKHGELLGCPCRNVKEKTDWTKELYERC